ncbi:hypothetical protein F5890DRAFT_1548269 [Lentinula detonsa]|uniref:Uncharacterized protein n=1 Tax=Lentinula detonsa TaxID=2804962 RepID=A0AA38UMD1_9AGAR|nr:hypothetical protein F5890DRAFT_1548269 [Lentinula detonsa]
MILLRLPIRTLKWRRRFGNRVWSDTNTNTDDDTGMRLDHGHGSGYALHGSSTSADAYGPSPGDDGYNTRRGQDPQSFRRISHDNNEDTFDDSRDIDTSQPVSNNSDSPGSGFYAHLLNISATDADDNVDQALVGLVRRIPSRSRNVGGKGKRTMNERKRKGQGWEKRR